MAQSTENLTFSYFLFSTFCCVCPNSMCCFLCWIDMVKLKIFCRPAAHAEFSSEKGGSSPLYPFPLKFSLAFRVFIRHILTLTHYSQHVNMVRTERLELSTPGLEDQCSNPTELRPRKGRLSRPKLRRPPVALEMHSRLRDDSFHFPAAVLTVLLGVSGGNGEIMRSNKPAA